jgi:surface protein
MEQLFNQALSFVGGDLSQWNTSNVEIMSYIFDRCRLFRGDVSLWDVSKVTDIRFAFEFCLEFDGDVSSWNTGNVVNMQGMFKDAWVFSSDVSNWNVASVTIAPEMVGLILCHCIFYAVWEQQSHTGLSR